jgi:hypothetical protein
VVSSSWTFFRSAAAGSSTSRTRCHRARSGSGGGAEANGRIPVLAVGEGEEVGDVETPQVQMAYVGGLCALVYRCLVASVSERSVAFNGGASQEGALWNRGSKAFAPLPLD